MSKIKVSACIITYNQIDFIRECLLGAVTQKLNVSYEIIIGDDCSTDGTSKICEEFANKYPEIITYHRREKNLGRRGNWIATIEQCNGKYVALCEGDDYWIDPLKLQKQVHFLEKNPSYSLTSGGYTKRQDNFNENVIVNNATLFPIIRDNGFEYEIDASLKAWVFLTLTVVFRNNINIVEISSKYKYFGDTHLMFHLLKNGKGFYFQQIFAVYNVHKGALHSMIGEIPQTKYAFKIYKEMYKVNKDEVVRMQYVHFNLKAMILYNGGSFFTGIKLVKNCHELVTLCKIYLKSIIRKK